MVTTAVDVGSTTAPQGTAARYLQIAKGQLGVVEGPKSNQTIYGAFTKANFEPWCGSFQMWVANQAGVKIPNCVYTPSGAQAFLKAKQWFTSNPQPGDLVFFSWTGKNTIDQIEHIGVVVCDNGDGTITTIEGNTNNSVHASQTNGGEVCQQVRGAGQNKRGLYNCVVGYGRPNYVKSAAAPITPAVPKVIAVNAYPGHTTNPGDFGDAVKFIQAKLNVTVDGQYGPVTGKVISAFQARNPKLGEANGIVGPLTWKAIAAIK